MPLTDAVVRKLKPNSLPAKLTDEKGLYLEVSTNGSFYWRFKFRYGGKEKRLALGVYPEVSLKEARERRDEARTLLRNGIDPSEHRKAKKASAVRAESGDFEVVAREWHAKFSPSWNSQQYRGVTLRRLERNVFPWLGKRPIHEITAPELLTVIRRMEERKAIDTAHRILSLCGQIFRYAIATSRAERDITLALRGALVPRKVRHFAATTDLKRLAEILRAFESYRGAPQVRAALRLAPMIFVRPGELRQAQWKEFDLEGGLWRFLVTKTETHHVVPLSAQAVAILKELQPITGRGPFVFPNGRTLSRPMSNNAVLAAMRRMGIREDEMTGHGFRAVARTLLDEEIGARPDIIEHQLGHVVKDPNGRAYNRTAHLAARRLMMQEWADYLDELRNL